MKPLFISITTSTVLATLLAIGPAAHAADILPGIDLFKTPSSDLCPTSVYLNVPAGFFSPSSKPIGKWAQLRGQPLATNPPNAIGTADTIVERLGPTTSGLVCGAGEEMVDIVLRAMHLVGAAPVAVAFDDGSPPQQWDFKVCATKLPTPQPVGSMTIRHECYGGGTFDSTLNLLVDLVFTPHSGGGAKRLMGVALTLSAYGSPWVHIDPSATATTLVDPFVTVDGDCDGVQDPGFLTLTSNFVPGLAGGVCECLTPEVVVTPICNIEKKAPPLAGGIHSVVSDPYDPDPGEQPIGEPLFVGDHFFCYKARDKTKPPQDPGVITLTDQFGTNTYNAGLAKMLCTPSIKNGVALEDPDVHLKVYKLRSVSTNPLAVAPRHVSYKTVTRDELGEFAMRLRSDHGFELMVPASKSVPPDLPPDPPVPGEHNVDHYKCYKAHLDATTGPAFPKNIEVEIEDQFGIRSQVKVKKPRMLCVPADKNGEGIADQVHHRTCYQVRLKRFKVPDVQVNDQFGPEVLKLRRPRLLCLVSRKTVTP